MKKVFLSLIVILFALSCQKDKTPDFSQPGVGIPKFASSPLNGSVAGIVVNENNLPVANAQVVVASTVYTTDNRGFFNTATLTLDKYISTVKVTMPGYFTAYRSFSANATKNYVSIKLIPKTLAGSFLSSTAGSITLTNGSSINFQPNALNIKSTGVAYSGNVKVYAAYIDPTAEDIGTRVPGSMMAEDANHFYVLRSTGMIAVELESAGGEPLQLITSRPAILKLAIAPSVISKAPAIIDTWSLDGRGIWIKEGTATKNGNMYEFTVSHFSFWNCDVPINAIYLILNIKNQTGNNLINTPVSLTSSTSFGTRWGNTDSLGFVSGMVPKDETLEMKVFGSNYSCSMPFYTQNMGPFAVNTQLNIITTLPVINSVTITGSAVNCAGAPLQNGTLIIHVGLYTLSYASITNGAFNITLPTCSTITSADLIAIDNVTQQQSASITLPVTGSTLNAGTISACGIYTNQFINYTVDGTNFIINGINLNANLSAYSMGNRTGIFAYDQSNSNRISFLVNGGAVGTFSVLPDSLQVNAFTWGLPQPTSTATFTSYGPVNQYLEGSFNIPFQATGMIHTLTGTFRIRRQ